MTTLLLGKHEYLPLSELIDDGAGYTKPVWITGSWSLFYVNNKQCQHRIHRIGKFLHYVKHAGKRYYLDDGITER